MFNKKSADKQHFFKKSVKFLYRKINSDNNISTLI